MRVLITDGDDRAALAAARSLRATGFDTCVAAPRGLSLAGVSRGVVRCAVPEDPLADPAGYVTALAQHATRLGAGVLLPITDAAVEALLAYPPSPAYDLVVPLPSYEAYRAASDKAGLLRLAGDAGFAVPDTVVVTGAVETAPPADMFPAVLKPHRSVVGSGARRRKVGVLFADDPRSYREALSTLPVEAYPVLVQRRVSGPGEGVFLLRWSGHVVAAFAHRRLREKPPAGGVSVYRESIPLDPALLEPAVRLLEGLDWSGVAMIETKRDRRTGRPTVMEVNGRLWGSLQLAVDAGVDFPALLVRCALGLPVTVREGYRVGVRSRWFWGDVDHLYMRFRRSATALHLEPGGPSRLATLVEFCKIRLGRDRPEIWRASDPAPFALETLRRLGLPW